MGEKPDILCIPVKVHGADTSKEYQMYQIMLRQCREMGCILLQAWGQNGLNSAPQLDRDGIFVTSASQGSRAFSMDTGVPFQPLVFPSQLPPLGVETETEPPWQIRMPGLVACAMGLGLAGLLFYAAALVHVKNATEEEATETGALNDGLASLQSPDGMERALRHISNQGEKGSFIPVTEFFKRLLEAEGEEADLKVLKQMLMGLCN